MFVFKEEDITRERVRHRRMVKNHHPIVLGFDMIQRAKGVVDREIVEQGGISDMTVKHWRRGGMPGVANLDAALRVMGFRLAIARIDEEPDQTILTRRVPA